MSDRSRQQKSAHIVVMVLSRKTASYDRLQIWARAPTRLSVEGVLMSCGEVRRLGKLSVWAGAKMRECYGEASKKMRADRELYRIFSEEHGLLKADHRTSPVRLPFIVPASRLKTTSGGSLLGTEGGSATGGVRPAACGGQYDEKLQAFGHTRQHEPQRCKSCSSTRCTARSLRPLDVCAQALGKPAERWRQPSQDGCTVLARKEVGSEKWSG